MIVGGYPTSRDILIRRATTAVRPRLRKDTFALAIERRCRHQRREHQRSFQALLGHSRDLVCDLSNYFIGRGTLLLYASAAERCRVCIDHNTPIQALDRLDPVLPLSPGRAERHGFEYYRHGTVSLYAALDTKPGRVHGKTAARHVALDFGTPQLDLTQP
jgi:hypothetical protein